MVGGCMQAFIVSRVGRFYFPLFCFAAELALCCQPLKKQTNYLPVQVSQACHSYFKHAAYWTKIISPPRNPLPGLTSSKYLGERETGRGGGGGGYGRFAGGKRDNEWKWTLLSLFLHGSERRSERRRDVRKQSSDKPNCHPLMLNECDIFKMLA